MKTNKQLNVDSPGGAPVMLTLASGEKIPLSGDGIAAFLGDTPDDDDPTSGDFLGDMFLGEPTDEDEALGDAIYDAIQGDLESEEAQLRDIEGDMFMGKGLKFGKVRLGQFLMKATPAGMAAKVAGKAIKRLRATGNNKAAARLQKRVNMKLMKQNANQTPGDALAKSQISPIIANNMLINQTPTRGLIPGASFHDTIIRSLTQYPGTTRTQTVAAAAGTVTFTFAAPAGSEGGNIQFVPIVLIQLTTQRQFSIANAQINVRFTTALDEAGVAVDYRTFSLITPEGLNSGFIALVPYREIASTLFPAIVQARAASNLVLELAGVPTNTNVRVILPGPDSAQYQTLLSGMGVPLAGRGLIHNI